MLFRIVGFIMWAPLGALGAPPSRSASLRPARSCRSRKLLLGILRHLFMVFIFFVLRADRVHFAGFQPAEADPPASARNC